MTNRTLHDGGLARASIGFALVSMLGFGLLYSLAGTGLGHALFPPQATGSVMERDGKVVGSALVAQPFADARYFQPRPSAAGYDPTAAAGSNMARTNPDLRKRIAEVTAEVAARDGVAASQVPGELVTQSGGGLDPHLSPEAARVQAARVARARGMSVDAVQQAIAANTEGAQFGLIGQPRVNVLRLNLALDATAAASR